MCKHDDVPFKNSLVGLGAGYDEYFHDVPAGPKTKKTLINSCENLQAQKDRAMDGSRLQKYPLLC